MMDNAAPVSLLSSTMVKLVFDEILQSRSVLFKDIRDKLVSRGGPAPAKAEIEGAVKALVDASLVKERPASIEDFNSYYVTADGLNAGRQLRLSGSPAS